MDGPKEGEIDPAIEHILVGLNNLPFVVETTTSCSGHSGRWFEGQGREGYVTIHYKGKDLNKVKTFHNLLKSIKVNNRFGAIKVASYDLVPAQVVDRRKGSEFKEIDYLDKPGKEREWNVWAAVYLSKSECRIIK